MRQPSPAASVRGPSSFRVAAVLPWPAAPRSATVDNPRVIHSPVLVGLPSATRRPTLISMTSTDMPKLSVRSIADLIAAVPYLLGFHPSQSIVVVAFRRKRLVFIARVDLPPAGASSESLLATAEHLTSIVVGQEVDAATVLGYGPADTVTPAAATTAAALDAAGLPVLDAIRVHEGRYWSYTCDNPRCCPMEGTPYDPTTTAIAAAATYAGHVALPDRAALARRVAPVEGPAREAMRCATERANRRLTALLGGMSFRRGDQALLQAGRVAVRAAFERHRAGGHLTDDEVAWLTVLLEHVPVRDDAWARIGPEDWQVALWTDVLRRAEPHLAAAPACLLAFAAWRNGQGALASVAIDRARCAVPDYSMALLMEQVLQYGVSPAMLDGWPGRNEGAKRRSRRFRRPGRRGSGGGGRTDKVLLTEGGDHDWGSGSDPARRTHHRRPADKGDPGVAGLRARTRRRSPGAAGGGAREPHP